MRFYHNPRCSKSRQALALLEERGVEVNLIRYLETGVEEADLPIIAQLEHVVRKKEAGSEAMASLNGPEDVMALLRSNPRALERPRVPLLDLSVGLGVRMRFQHSRVGANA